MISAVRLYLFSSLILGVIVPRCGDMFAVVPTSISRGRQLVGAEMVVVVVQRALGPAAQARRETLAEEVLVR